MNKMLRLLAAFTLFIAVGCFESGSTYRAEGPVKTEADAIAAAKRYIQALPPYGPAANYRPETARVLYETKQWGPAPPGSWLVGFDIEGLQGAFVIVEVNKESGEAGYYKLMNPMSGQ